ncbi:MAG: lecithin retinol acyltransferase family protein [Spirochaetales bacterium]|jgi:hypothetical protein|nr:lecithin retinol acyltransferase family protein [Spirochaetales bacterium]
MGSFLRKGDVIYADRGLYRHYGIYNNAGSVIHFSPDKGAEINPENAYIRETTLAEFLKGGEPRVDKTVRAVFPPDEVVRRAQCLAGSSRGDYNFVFYNCEHFTHWCATGELESKQVKKGAIIAGAIAVTTVAAVVVGKAIADKGKKDKGEST